MYILWIYDDDGSLG